MAIVKLEKSGNFMWVTDSQTSIVTRFPAKDTYYAFEDKNRVLVLTWDKNNGETYHKYKVSDLADSAGAPWSSFAALDSFLAANLGFNGGGGSPVNQVNTDWNSTSGVSKLLNKPTLFSGNFNDLLGVPDFLSYQHLVFDNFLMLVDNDNLKPGNWYLIEDFSTIYDMPDFYDNGDPILPTNETVSSVVEPLLVLAISSNKISDRVYSTLYPNDFIRYDITNIRTEITDKKRPGKIVERIDTENNLRAGYDFRHILFKRYSIHNLNEYNSYKQIPSGDVAEFTTFAIGAKNMDIYSARKNYNTIFELPNSVFSGNKNYDVTTESDFYNNTFMKSAVNSSFGAECRNNTFYANFANNVIGNEFQDNTFTVSFTNNKIATGFARNVWTEKEFSWNNTYCSFNSILSGGAGGFIPFDMLSESDTVHIIQRATDISGTLTVRYYIGFLDVSSLYFKYFLIP